MNQILYFIGKYPFLETLIYLFLLLFFAFSFNFIIKKVLLRLIDHFLNKIVAVPNIVYAHGILDPLASTAPALMISTGIVLVPHLPAPFISVIQNVSNAFIIFALGMTLTACLNILEVIYHKSPRSHLKPIKGYIQTAKIFIYFITFILMVAALIDRSPLILISSLGAMAAVLILIFQDTLLSLVAGIQISSTDMVRVGDWIEMPTLGSDGEVSEISLYTVRVQNWDKTIGNIPIRNIVTEPFKNWRGMQESGARRIKRSLFLDQTSIRFLTDVEIKNLEQILYLKSYLQQKEIDLKEWNEQFNAQELPHLNANKRQLTNIGIFRIYIEHYIRHHPLIHQDLTLLVRQLQPGRDGIPLELYCFTKTTLWNEYEAIQSDIFDHLLAIVPEFHLRIFQDPIGADLRQLTQS